MGDTGRAIDLIVSQTSHAVHGGWEVRDGIIVCAWDGERIAEAPGGSDE